MLFIFYCEYLSADTPGGIAYRVLHVTFELRMCPRKYGYVTRSGDVTKSREVGKVGFGPSQELLRCSGARWMLRCLLSEIGLMKLFETVRERPS